MEIGEGAEKGRVVSMENGEKEVIYTFTDGEETFEVPKTIQGLIDGLDYKAHHIKAKTDPGFFMFAAVAIEYLINEASMAMEMLEAIKNEDPCEGCTPDGDCSV